MRNIRVYGRYLRARACAHAHTRVDTVCTYVCTSCTHVTVLSPPRVEVLNTISRIRARERALPAAVRAYSRAIKNVGKCGRIFIALCLPRNAGAHTSPHCARQPRATAFAQSPSLPSTRPGENTALPLMLKYLILRASREQISDSRPYLMRPAKLRPPSRQMTSSPPNAIRARACARSSLRATMLENADGFCVGLRAIRSAFCANQL